jgi:hypothetical protein
MSQWIRKKFCYEQEALATGAWFRARTTDGIAFRGVRLFCRRLIRDQPDGCGEASLPDFWMTAIPKALKLLPVDETA